jgi:hypothetical protein
MKSAVILLPGLNRDRDMIAALTRKHLIIHSGDLEASRRQLQRTTYIYEIII